jgi:phage tail-like protein
MAGSVTTTSAFVLEMDSVQIANFKSVGGLKNEIEAIEFKQSTSEGRMEIQYHPGASKWEVITLERYFDGSTALSDWYNKLMEKFNPSSDKVTGSIYGIDKTGERTMQWDFVKAWPTGYEGPELNVESNELVTEKVTIRHEGIRKIK